MEKDYHNVSDVTTAICAGNEVAFDMFYKRYANRLYRYLISLANGDEHLAQDLLQIAMLKIIRNMKEFFNEDDFWRWLVRVIKTTMIDHVRKNRKNELHISLDDNERLMVDTDLFEEKHNIRLSKSLDKALNKLPLEDKKLIEEFYFKSKSYKQIADNNFSTEKAIGMKLSRLRKKLKDMINKELSCEV